MKLIPYSLLLILVLSMASCVKTTTESPVLSKTLSLPDKTFDYSTNVFDNQQKVNTENPVVTNHGATLGRVLFYDPALSLNNRVSCNSCHLQEFAFADGRAHSLGFEDKVTPRNAMAINNPVLNRSLFWDSRASSATNLALQPAQNHIEMGMENLDYLASKLSKIKYYPELFRKAFGTETINKEKIANAMAQFLCGMTTTNAKIDRVNNGTETLTALEELGSNIFHGKGKCFECHAGQNFMADDSPSGPYGGGGFGGGESLMGTTNTGLDRFTQDEGRNNGKFRIPSLRNIAVTGPYMHDGRFKTLEEVVDFYSTGIQAHEDLDPKFMENGQPIRFNFSDVEKNALIAFLNALTDNEYLTAEKYSSPFK